MKILLLILLPLSCLAMHHPKSRSVGNSPIRHPRVRSIRKEFLLDRQLGHDHNYNLQPLELLPSPPRFDHVVSISPEEIKIHEIKAHVQEVKAISRKKIACIVAVSAVTSAILTAAVTLTIHFTECKK